MVRRSHKRRKQFTCGHRGFGRFCHRCFQANNPAQAPQLNAVTQVSPPELKPARVWSTAHSIARHQWQQSFAHDPIDLTHLPKPIVLRARRILAALDQGVAPAQLLGRRFNFDRTLLRIPVTYRYRLLCRWQVDRIVPLQVLSHEAYNAIAHNKKRLKGS